MMYLLRGSLPWQGLKVYGKEDKYQKILQKKKETPVEELCKGYANEFCDFIKYVKMLSYIDDPNYDYIKAIFNEISKIYDFAFDFKFDWMKNDYIKPEKTTENNDKTSNKALKDMND